MLLDAFLHFDGDPNPGGANGKIAGECTVDSRADQIEILSFEQRVERLSKTDTARVRSSLGPMQIIKPLDKTSPTIYEASSKGYVYPLVKINVCQPKADGSARVVYLEIEMKQVRIDFVHLIGNPQLHSLQRGSNIPAVAQGVLQMGPLDRFELNFEEITWLYKGAAGTGNFSGAWTRPQQAQGN